MKTKIGIFGGTFDPVHNGHVECVQYILNNSFIDEIIIVPSGSPPHKNNDNITHIKHRIKMLKIAFKNIASISKIECKKTPSFTYSTLRELKKIKKNCEFFFILGEDNLYSINKWKEYKKLIHENDFILMRRSGFDISYNDCPELKLIEFNKLTANKITTPLIPISSSQIKQMIKKNYKNIELFLHPKIIEYIKKNNLYN